MKIALADLVLLLVLLICVWTDLQERKIYNKVVFPAVFAGVVIHTASLGLPGMKTSIVGFIAGMLLFLVPFALGGLGAGDVKLLGAVGALKGPLFALYTALGTALVGGVIAVAFLLWRHELWPTLKRLTLACVLFMSGRWTGKKGALLLLERTPYSSLFPYGLAISLGTIAAYCIIIFQKTVTIG